MHFLTSVSQQNKTITNPNMNIENFSQIFENAIDMTQFYFFPFPLPELNTFDLCSSLPLFCESYVEPEDSIDALIRQLREVRVRLGFTQTELSDSITALCGRKISQTTICRFEGQMLTARNMRKLAPTFEEWIRLAKNEPERVRWAVQNCKRSPRQRCNSSGSSSPGSSSSPY